MELPEKFISSMKELLAGEYDDFIASYDDKPLSALRINTSKISPERFCKIAPFDVQKIPFSENGMYINDTDAWSKHPYYYAGLYYIQEPSAMLPASMLPIDRGDIVLDLCAAPGGKSTAIASSACDVLISNDISQSRAIPLVVNLEHTGTFCHAVTVEDPKRLEMFYPESFDKILVDAPCSGEGMFRKDRMLIKSYSDKGPSYYHKIQRSILESAYNMLKRGGMMLYSTCTFSDIEDEQVILSFLNDHDDISVVEINKQNGLSGVYPKYEDEMKLQGCVHAFPHRFKGEGHFMALMKKAGDGKDVKNDQSINRSLIGFESLPTIVKDFYRHLSDGYKSILSECRYLLNGESIYMIDEKVSALYNRNIRYARTGLNLGNIKNDLKFTPSTAFALTLKIGDFDNVLDLRSDDPVVISYLRGETLVLDPAISSNVKKGIVLVCTDTYPLGFASFDGTKYKNLYEKGWIYR